jgi:hypothetical protein
LGGDRFETSAGGISEAVKVELEKTENAFSLRLENRMLLVFKGLKEFANFRLLRLTFSLP